MRHGGAFRSRTYVPYVRRYVPYVRYAPPRQVQSAPWPNALDAPQGRGAPPLRRDRRARGAGADPARLRGCSTSRRSRSGRSRGSTPTPSPPTTARRAARSPTCSAARPRSRPRRWRWRSSAATGSSGSSSRRPATSPTADAWLDAFFAGESARGPAARREPAVDYGFLWALWLSAVPYGIWSERGPAARAWTSTCSGWSGSSASFGEALEHFGLTLREGTTLNDLACAIASLIEGVWLNQCLTDAPPVATRRSRSRRCCGGRAGCCGWARRCRHRTG